MTTEMKTDRAKFWTTFFKQFYGVGMVSHPVSEEMLAWSASLAMRASLKATLDCAAAFAATDFRPDLPYFKVPTLIIHGTSDKTVKIDATGRAAAAAIRGSTLLEYEGAAHGLIASHKERFIEDVLNFVKTVDYQPSVTRRGKVPSPRVTTSPVV
jgi:pimeloyl-ACP methyl ester carboxylesterase